MKFCHKLLEGISAQTALIINVIGDLAFLATITVVPLAIIEATDFATKTYVDR